MPSLVAPSLLASVRESVDRHWGYDGFRPHQLDAISAVLEGRDSLVVLPTGGGKSLCFQAPATCLEGTALVVSPLISLMKDQVDRLQQRGIAAAFVNSALPLPERRVVSEQMRRGELKLLYIAPERLLTDATLQFLQTVRISFVAIDEAHCISSWGTEFRPEYRGLSVLKRVLPNVGVHAYTATASAQVRQDIVQQLGLLNPTVLVGNIDRPNLIYRVVRPGNRFAKICEIVGAHPQQPGIVYCLSRKEVDKTATALSELGIRALPYHAGLDDQTRRRNQEAFLNDSVDVIVATVAFGLGIDKPNIRFVIHAVMPKSIDQYQQECGRAGRDGLPAECWLLFSGGDTVAWRRMIDDSPPTSRLDAMRALERMQQFCGSIICRHRTLAEYFGQSLAANNCGACDVCLGETQLVDDPSTIASKIISCVLRLRENFGAEYTSKVLAGRREARIASHGHDELSTFGILQQENLATIRAWIDQLVEQQYLEKAGNYQVLRATSSGRQLLKGIGQTPQLRTVAQQQSSGSHADHADLSSASIAAFPFFRRGASLDEVCRQLNRAPSTVQDYLADYLRHEQVSDPSPWVAAEQIERIEDACRTLGIGRLKPIFEYLGGEITYGAIRIVVTCVRNRAALAELEHGGTRTA